MFKNEIVTFVMGMGAAAGTTLATTLTQSLAPVTVAGDASLVVAFVGASASTLVAATIASMLAMGISKPIEPRSTMWLYFIISAMLGAAAATVAVTAPFMKEYLGGVHPAPVAFIASFPGRWVIPVIVEEVPKRVRRLIRGETTDGETP